MHKQPYLGRIALYKEKKSLKGSEIRAFYGILGIALRNETRCQKFVSILYTI